MKLLNSEIKLVEIELKKKSLIESMRLEKQEKHLQCIMQNSEAITALTEYVKCLNMQINEYKTQNVIQKTDSEKHTLRKNRRKVPIMFSSNQLFQNIIFDHINNETIKELFGYSKQEAFSQAAILNQIGNDLKVIIEACSINVGSFSVMEQLEKLNIEKRKNTISIKLLDDAKTINKYSQTLRKQIEEYEQQIELQKQNKSPTKTSTITSNLELNKIFDMYIKNKFITSIFRYISKSDFIKIAFLNQIKNDLKELQQEQQ
ncbi:hypothetical protein HMPREF1430_00937 [Helicobacter pylori GAM96Ai]|nr:hypothetical protein HMPREF1430_00937 [Helicobacter pylori GAM96Ai]